MAKKRKIMVDVIVDDKGTTKKMAVSQRQLDGAMKDTEKSTRAARKQIRGAAQTASAGGKQFAALASGTGGLVGAYATLAAQIFAVTAAFNFLKEAGSLKLLQEGQLAYTSAVGTSMKALTQDIQAATGAQLSFREAAQAGAIATAAGLAPDQITALGKAAKDTSTILGRDLTDSFNRLVRGVTKAEPELLDELGIILRLEEAQQKYKDSLGITGELTAFQRSQAVTADVLAQVEQKYSRVLAVTGASENEFQKLATAFDEIVMGLQEFAVKFLTPVARLLAEFPMLIVAAFAPFTISILRAALPGLGNLRASLAETAASAQVNFDKATAAQAKFTNDTTRLAASKTLQKALLKEVGAETRAATQKVKIRKGSLLAQLRDGKQLSNAQIKQIRLNLEKEARGYKIKDKKVLASLERNLKRMEQLNAATTNKMKLQFQTLGAKISSTFDAATLKAKASLASLTSFAEKAAGRMAKALNAISWITLIASLGSLVYAFFRTEDAAEEVADEFDFLADKAKTLQEETDKFVKVQNILNEEFDRGNFALEAFAKRLENVSSKTIADALATSNLGKAMADFSAEVSAAEAAIPGLERQLESLREEQKKQAKESSTKGGQFSGVSDFVQSNRAIVEVQNKLDAARKSATQGFDEYAAASGDITDATNNSIKILMREKEELQGITNERFRGNSAVVAYEQSLTALENKQKVDIDLLLEQREAVQKLGRQFSELTRLQSENARTNSQLITKMLPLTETDTFLEKLSQQKFLLLETAKANGELTESEEKQLAVIEQRQKFFGSVAITETTAKASLIALQVQEAKLLAGKTKLVQDDIKSSVKIAQNKVKEFELQQKIGHAQELLAKSRKEEEKLLKSTNENERLRGQELQSTNNARERSIILQGQSLELLQAQTAELQRQKNELQEIRDGALQAFESSAQAGIAALIKGTKSFKDALTDLATNVLNSIADTLAKQITTKIMGSLLGVKAPEEKMAAAIENASKTGADTLQVSLAQTFEEGGTSIANKIRAATGATPANITPSASGGGTGTGTVASAAVAATKDPEEETNGGKFSLKRYLVGSNVKVSSEELTGEAKGETTVTKGLQGGIFSKFITNFKGIFEENTVGGFLGQLGKTFMSGAEGFGSLFTDLLGGLFGGGGGGGGGLMGLLTSFLPFRYGGIASYRYGGRMDRYSTGGIARGPQAGYPAVLHGNEAIVPLPSGGKIPVEMKGGAGQTNNVGVTVNISGDGQATTEMAGDPGRSEALGKLVAGAVQEELQRQRRPGGILSPYGAAGGI